MNISLNKAQKVSRNKLSPLSHESEASSKRNNPFFPYSIEDTSIDFTRNIEFSPTHDDSSSLPNSLQSVKSMSAHNPKKNINDLHETCLEKNSNYQLEIRKEYSYNKGQKVLTIPVFEKKSFILTEQNKKNVKLHQIWPSNNRFLFQGRIIFGPKSDCCHYIFVLILIFGVSIVFCVLVIPYLWTDISPILPCFIIYLFISTITFLILTTFTDPGIIPKKKVFDLFGGVPSPFMENLDNSDEAQSRDKKYRFDKDTLGSGRTKKRKKYCHTCEIYRPSRASHCNDCGNCVEVFDHHCPFVNNCIGKRNYRYFLGFLISLVLLGISEIAGFLLRLIIIFGQGVDNINQSSMVTNSTLVLVVICIISIPTGIVIICLSGLCFYHIVLVVKGKTTKESIRKMNYDEGMLDERKQMVNWCKTDPSLFDSKYILNDEQIEIIKQKWAGEANHKSSTSF